MTAVILTIIILGVLIIVHEAGHFAVAKWRGVRVERFSVGFGPKIVGFKKGETEYMLSAVPFGGYVKMAGDDPDAVQGTPEEFLSRPQKDKFAIVLAGPLANMVLGFVFFFGAALLGRQYIPGNRVAKVEEGSPARSAGIAPGDIIISVNGKPFSNWSDLPGGKAHLVIQRGRDTIEITAESLRGIVPFVPPVLGKLVPGEPADKHGLAPGDTVLALDSARVASWDEMVEYIRARPHKEIVFLVKRGEDTLKIPVKTQKKTVLEQGKEKTVGAIGALAPTKTQKMSPFAAFREGFLETLLAAGFIFMILGKILTGGISVGSVGGPLMIGKVVGQSWGLGMAQLLSTAGLISVNLAVINLLPIPGLDGGHLTIFTLEGISRRKIPPAWHVKIQVAGLVLVVALMVVVTVMDIRRLFFQ